MSNSDSRPTLFVVGTPIGNLADMTYRAVETLRSADLIIAEDTRHTGILCREYEIQIPRTSFHAQSDIRRAKALCDQIIRDQLHAVYVSDAGTPCISDPGYRLVRMAVEQGIAVIPVPGASALTTLVSVAGVPADRFVWHGFLPHKKGRQTLIQSFIDADKAQIFYESVHRMDRLLSELTAILEPERLIVIGRELTKLHEEIFRGTVTQAREHFSAANLKGEFVVLLSPKMKK